MYCLALVQLECGRGGRHVYDAALMLLVALYVGTTRVVCAVKTCTWLFLCSIRLHPIGASTRCILALVRFALHVSKPGNAQGCVDILIHQHRSLEPHEFQRTASCKSERAVLAARQLVHNVQRLHCYCALPGSTSGVALTS